MSKINRLKNAREDAGYRSASAAAEALGVSGSTYRAHENGQNDFSFDDAVLYAKKFKVDPIWLFTGVSSKTETNNSNIPVESAQNLALAHKVTTIQVVGSAVAGVFRDITMLSNVAEFEEIYVVADPRFPLASQYALKVEGDSMDREFPHGSFVHCIEFAVIGKELEDGMVAHVEKYVGGGQLVENTLKEVKIRDGVISLCPNSTNEKHRELVLDGGEDTEIIVRGLVAGMYKPRKF